MREIEYQKFLVQKLSDPGQYLTSKQGTRIQILSLGRLNTKEGPDFKGAAILFDDKLKIGDIEVHLLSSDWIRHNHNLDSKYGNVILHIVKKDDSRSNLLETLEISNIEPVTSQKLTKDIESNIEIQEFALSRLLRMTSDFLKIKKEYEVEKAIILRLEHFIDRYKSKMKRPSYSKFSFEDLIKGYERSFHFEYQINFSKSIGTGISDSLSFLIKNSIGKEGAGLRREIVLNCIIPSLVGLSNERQRIELFNWYWNSQAIGSYGVLTKKFPRISQNYLWQQQGLLEFLRYYYDRQGVSERIVSYGFGAFLTDIKLSFENIFFFQSED